MLDVPVLMLLLFFQKKSIDNKLVTEKDVNNNKQHVKLFCRFNKKQFMKSLQTENAFIQNMNACIQFR